MWAASTYAADPRLDLNADGSCYQPGATITVTVDLTGDGQSEVVGGQFFLAYDTTKLSFQAMVPGDDG